MVKDPDLESAVREVADFLNSYGYDFIQTDSKLTVSSPFGEMTLLFDRSITSRYGFDFSPISISVTTPYWCNVEQIPFDYLTLFALTNAHATASALVDDRENDSVFYFSRLVFDQWTDECLLAVNLILGRQIGDMLDGAKNAFKLFRLQAERLASAGSLAQSERELVSNLELIWRKGQSLLEVRTIPPLRFERFDAADLQSIAAAYPDAIQTDLQESTLKVILQWSIDRHSWVPMWAMGAVLTFSIVNDHPSCGSGMLVRMELTLDLEDELSTWLANSLNVASVTDHLNAMFVGAWFADEGRVKFGCFLPNHLKKHTNLLLSLSGLEEHHKFAYEYITDLAMKTGKEALTLRDSGDYGSALDRISRSLQMFPYSGDLNNYRGLIQMSIGDYEEAIKSFNRATAFNRSLGKAHHNRAMVYEKLDRIADAIEAYEAAIEAGEPSEHTFAQLSRAYSSAGDLDKAIDCADQGIELHPFSGVIYGARGDAFRLSREMRRAIEDLETAVQLGEHRYPVFNNLGVCYLAEGEFPKAIEWLTEALQIDPEAASSYAIRAEAYRRMGNEQLAREDDIRARQREESNLDREDVPNCELHGSPMEKQSVPVVYGLPSFDNSSFEAQDKLFPNSNRTVLGGCIYNDDLQTLEVWVCHQCRHQEETWIEKNHK